MFTEPAVARAMFMKPPSLGSAFCGSHAPEGSGHLSNGILTRLVLYTLPIGTPCSIAAASVKALKELPADRLIWVVRLILCLEKFCPPYMATMAPVCGTTAAREALEFEGGLLPGSGRNPSTAARAYLCNFGLIVV